MNKAEFWKLEEMANRKLCDNQAKEAFFYTWKKAKNIIKMQILLFLARLLALLAG